MRYIQVEDGLRLRFAARDEEFDQGVEMGILVAQMSAGQITFTRSISTASVDQARSLAAKMGYHLVVASADETSAEITFRAGRARPKLTVVHSRPATGHNAVA